MNEQRRKLENQRHDLECWRMGWGRSWLHLDRGPRVAVRSLFGMDRSLGDGKGTEGNGYLFRKRRAMALRVLIVDDEADARENLQLMLAEHAPEVEIAGQAGSAEEARARIQELQPNALFLDIKMPGEDGFGLLASIAELDIPVVFTTAYDEYALKAFKQNALDYLEKPIDHEELERAVKKLQRAVGELDNGGSSAILALMKDPASPLSSRVAVPGREGLVLLKHDDILYLEANDSYTTIHLRDGKRSVSSKHIRVFEINLNAKSFFRVHKSYIINLAHLKGFSRSEGNMAVLENDVMIPVSRRRLPDFLGLINTF